MRVVDTLVAFVDRSLPLVEVSSTIVVVVVVGGVFLPCVADAVVGDALCKGAEVGIAVERLLLGVGKSVVAHILFLARAGRGGKGVGLCGLHGDLSPLCGGETAGAIDGHSTLVELLSVAQYVLAHLAEVDVEVAAIVVAVGFVA